MAGTGHRTGNLFLLFNFFVGGRYWVPYRTPLKFLFNFFPANSSPQTLSTKKAYLQSSQKLETSHVLKHEWVHETGVVTSWWRHRVSCYSGLKIKKSLFQKPPLLKVQKDVQIIYSQSYSTNSVTFLFACVTGSWSFEYFLSISQKPPVRMSRN